ncbi:GFA family protein [Mycobacterium sp.]|uniref:GFA family protein n=1 Tax=Mycobacterium sp. TaxID=1785 RepID=UPI002604A31A|nr:GFA family protein [Mycobacterium sp.]
MMLGGTHMTTWKGGCHCGRIAFEVDGGIDAVVECNCSHCRPKGYLLWYRPREALRLSTPEADMSTYRFNRHAIAHHFCPVCGVAPFADGERDGQRMAAVNVRCLEGVEPTELNIRHVDGRSF